MFSSMLADYLRYIMKKYLWECRLDVLLIYLNWFMYLDFSMSPLDDCHFWTEELVEFLPFDFKNISSVIRSTVQF